VDEPQTISRRFSCVDAQLFQKYPNAFVKSDFLESYSLQKYNLFYLIAKPVKKTSIWQLNTYSIAKPNVLILLWQKNDGLPSSTKVTHKFAVTVELENGECKVTDIKPMS